MPQYCTIYYLQKIHPKEIINPTWDETGAGLGHNMDRPECRSQGFNTTHVCSYLFRNLTHNIACLLFTNCFHPQDTIESTWNDRAAGYGYTMPQLQGRQQMQQPENAGTSQTNPVFDIVNDFFGYDPSGTSSS